MATKEYCVILYLRGKTKSLKAWKNQTGGFFAVSQCIPVHFSRPEGLRAGSCIPATTNAMLAPWWMCKDMGFEQHSIEDWEKIYGMDGGWENDDPDEYSIRANEFDYKEACSYYAALRARKAAKKARYS